MTSTRVTSASSLRLKLCLLSVLPSICFSFPTLRQHATYNHHPQYIRQRIISRSQVPSADGPVRVRRRWRQRRKDSTVVPIASAESQCPLFSMTFPRYRIDLSSSSSKDAESEQRRARRVQRGIITKLVKPNSDNKSNNSDDRRVGENDNPFGRMGGVFKDALSKNNNKRARKSVESLYSEEVQQGLFRWVSSPAKESSSTADEEFLSAAAFWRMASDVIIYQSTMAQEQQNHQHMWFLALPDTTRTVVQNLCDVLNWCADLLDKNTEGGSNVQGREEESEAIILLRAELDSRSVNQIPVVCFTATTQNKGQNHLERRKLLPTAADTEIRTKAWVKRLLVQLGICPFTKSEVKSGQGLRDLGVPVANIMYRHSSALSLGSDMYLLMADAWEAISDMVAAGPSGVSSILLSAPGFDDDFELWAGPVFAMLETCVGAIQAEEMIGVVCFHPQYVTPDGKSWPGFGHMHSVPRLKKWYNQHSSSSTVATDPLSDNEIAAGGAWQRRTPHAVINVLRAEQLEAAEGRRSTGILYERNIRVLVGNEEESVGLEKLAEDLKREQHLYFDMVERKSFFDKEIVKH